MTSTLHLGPWEACGNLIRTKREADGSGGFLVAVVAVTMTNPSEKAQAARSMAAAPELLALARNIEALLSAQNWIADSASFAPEPRLLADARAAIAKATGSAT